MQAMAYPFKRAQLGREGRGNTEVTSPSQLQDWMRYQLGELRKDFTHGQSPGADEFLMVFCWADGMNPWVAVGESVVKVLSKTSGETTFRASGLTIYTTPSEVPTLTQPGQRKIELDSSQLTTLRANAAARA
ncbi:MAG: hypothetical protein JRN35_10670 [Nitrososphaerota archaeon]|nr:hypothetical protein [Nitrososphaerota archaeon]